MPVRRSICEGGNGRVYDPVVGRFLSPDPYVQMPGSVDGFNRYAYCLNNPLIYTDPEGEWFIIDDAIAAVVGGVINLATNWGNVDNFWEGLGAFGAGAANGWLTLNLGPLGSAIGGSITGAANNIIAQTGNGIGLNQVNWGQVGMQSLVGGASGIAGYGAGKWATNNLGNTIINGFKISSPVVSGAINGAVGGAVGGAAGGFTAGYLLSGGNMNAAWNGAWSGLRVGGALGGGFGAASGYRYAKQNNLNPWNGKSLTSKTTTVYRAVSPAEYEDIKNNGLRVNPDGSGYQEGKLFYKSYQDAVNNTAAYDAAFGQQSIIIEIQVPNNATVNFNYFHMDGYDVIFIRVTDLPTMNSFLNLKPLD